MAAKGVKSCHTQLQMATVRKSASKAGPEFIKKTGWYFEFTKLRLALTSPLPSLLAKDFNCNARGDPHWTWQCPERLAGSHLGQVNMSALEWQEYLRAKAILEPLRVSKII
jgi:hypothetical protein